MVSTRKKIQSERELLSQLEDFDKDVALGNALNNRHEITTVNEGTADQEFTVRNSEGGQAVDEKTLNVKTLERCFKERDDREMGSFVDTVGDRIQNAIFTARDSIFTPEPKQLSGQ